MGIAYNGRPGPEEALRACRSDPGAVLLDVRTPEEYSCGCLPESINLPVHRIYEIASLVPDTDTPIYVCCQSGARSYAAALSLRQMGYRTVTDLGGIAGG